MNILKSNIVKKASSYFMELIIVVVGVSIAFQLNVWNDTRKKKETEKQILKSFIVENKINQVDSSILLLEGLIEHNAILVDLLTNNRTEIDSIRQIMADLYSISWPDLITTHLDNYLEIESKISPLKEEMLLLKTRYQSTAHLIDMYIPQKQMKYFDYLADVVDIGDGLTIVNEDKLFDVRFRNNLIVLYYYERELIASYKELAETQKKIITLIEEKLD